MMKQNRGAARDFANVDKAVTAEMIAHLDAITEIMAQSKPATYARLQLRPGMAVLDAGCGTGIDVRAICEIVGTQGRVEGVDFSQAMIDEAIKRGVPANAQFRQGSATQLPFGDETFDAARCERVFQHLDRPEAGARELYRVLKPGGVVMLLDQDWDTLLIAGSKKEPTRTISRAFADHWPNGWAGRNNAGLLWRCGFRDVTVQAMQHALPFPLAMHMIVEAAISCAMQAGAVTAHDAAAFSADLQMAEERGEFYCGFTVFEATAVR